MESGGDMDIETAVPNWSERSNEFDPSYMPLIYRSAVIAFAGASGNLFVSVCVAWAVGALVVSQAEPGQLAHGGGGLMVVVLFWISLCTVGLVAHGCISRWAIKRWIPPPLRRMATIIQVIFVAVPILSIVMMFGFV